MMVPGGHESVSGRREPVVVFAESEFQVGQVFWSLLWFFLFVLWIWLLITIFAGWVMCRNSTAEELHGSGGLFKTWRILARFVAPIGILIVLINAVR